MTTDLVPSNSRKNTKMIDDESTISEKDPRMTIELESSTSETNERIRAELTSLDQDEYDAVVTCFSSRSLEEAVQIIEDAIEFHRHDACVPKDHIAAQRELIEQYKLEKYNESIAEDILYEAFLIADWSIYPEVRAVTKPICDKEERCETFRVYVLGIAWSCAGSALDTFFATRFPTIALRSAAIQILLVATGRLWSTLPKMYIPLGKKRKFWINPGPWTFKEQMLATLTMSVAVGTPYSMYAIVSQKNKYFYNLDGVDLGYMLMLTISSQLMGLGISGIMRSFLVYPNDTVWYGVLPTIALNRALTQPDSRVPASGWKLLRYEMFWIAAGLMFVWFWITNFLFRCLSFFDWPAWIAPNNVHLQAMTGIYSGLSINPLDTFDWNVISGEGMITPFRATMNDYLGIVTALVAVLIVWYKNVGYSGYLPVNSNDLYDNTGKPFVVGSVLDKKGNLDLEKYKVKSLPFYSAGNLISYGTHLMCYTAMLVYALLNYPRHICRSFASFWVGIKNFRKGSLHLYNDRFSRAQRKYKEVPEYWFLSILVGATAMSIATVLYYKFTNTPVWTIFFGMGLSLLFLPLFGRLYATTHCAMNINVLFEVIIGLALPGQGSALLVSKTYATNFAHQADSYCSNMKQGHYTGIPPRALFRTQMLSVVFNTFVQVFILHWQLNGGIRDLCNIKHPLNFRCLHTRTAYAAAVVWGTIGPKRVFETLYPSMKYCFLIGCFVPVPFYLARKFAARLLVRAEKRGGKGKKRILTRIIQQLENFNEMVFLSGCTKWGGDNLWGKTGNLCVGAFFNYYIKDKHDAWWKKYNYILNAGLSVGIAYGGLILFFSTEYFRQVRIDWWGNRVMHQTLDYLYAAPRLTVEPGTFFGPKPGTYD